MENSKIIRQNPTKSERICKKFKKIRDKLKKNRDPGISERKQKEYKKTRAKTIEFELSPGDSKRIQKNRQETRESGRMYTNPTACEKIRKQFERIQKNPAKDQENREKIRTNPKETEIIRKNP